MFYVNSQIIRALVHFLVSQGLNEQDLRACLGNKAQFLDDSRYQFELSAYEALMVFAAKSLNCEHIGLKFGQSLKTQNWGLLGHIALVSDNLQKVLQHAQKLNTLVRNIGLIKLEMNEEFSHLSWLAQTPINHYMVDELFSSWISFAAHCCQPNQALTLQSVHLTRSKPIGNSLKAYQLVFQCPIHWQAQANKISFKTALLNTRLSSPNQQLEQLLLAQAKELMPANDLVGQINVYIVNQLPKVATIDEVANQLNIKKRSLQRHLSQQGTSFSRLLDQIRKHQAKLLLQQGSSAVEVANQLGFSEQSALQRAFKRWYQCSPKKFNNSTKNTL